MYNDCNNSHATKNTDEIRCSCRQLVAVKTPDGLAIKCRRCKRIHVIPIETDFSGQRPPSPEPKK
jgi:phage FluMu protein Com